MSESINSWQNVIDEQGLPRDIETEKVIFGSILLDNDLMDSATTQLEESDFHLETHRHIWQSLLSLERQNIPLNFITLGADLEERSQLEKVGGRTFLASLTDGVPRTDTIEPYARILKRKSRERKLYIQFNHALNQLAEGGEVEDIVANVKQFCESINEPEAYASTGIYKSLSDFFYADLNEPEQIFLGIRRGEVVAFDAVTNQGKSTILLNLCLSMAGGQACIPLAPDSVIPRRILFVDCESPASMLRDDIKHMLKQIYNNELADGNFRTIVDCILRGKPLCLTRPDHFEQVIKWAKALKTDVVVIDTVASAFEVQDENSNAEITRRVMNPLKRLAREANCAVIFTHHIGKSGETQSGEGAYKGRGASAFGALSRTVYSLEKDASKGSGYVVLSCPKSKGATIEPTLLKLNKETRWFEVCGDKPTEKPQPPTAEEIADFIADAEHGTEEICEHFKDRASEKTIRNRIKAAESMGLISKPNKQAKYRIGNRQSLIELPITSSQTLTPKNHSKIAYCECGASGISLNHCNECGEFLH